MLIDDKKQKPNYAFNAIVVAAAFLFTIFIILSGDFLIRGLEVTVGSISDRRIKAPKDTVNEIATDRLKREAMDAVPDQFNEDPAISRRVMDNLAVFFAAVDEARLQTSPIEPPTDNMNPLQQLREPVNIVPDGSSIHLADKQSEYLLDADTRTYIDFKETVHRITQAELDLGIKNEGVTKSLVTVKDEIDSLDWDQTAKAIANSIIAGVIEPNMIIDEEATAYRRQERADQVEPIIYKTGQTIVDDGEPINEEIYAMLDSLGFISRSLDEQVVPLIGCIVFVVFAFVFIAYYIQQFYRYIIMQKKEILIILTLYVLVVGVARLMAGLPYYFIPVFLFSMLLSILIEARLSVMLTITLTFILGLIYESDLSFYIYFIVCGTTTALIARFTTNRNKVFSVGMLISLICAVTVYICALLSDRVFYSAAILNSVIYAVLSGLFSVIISIGSLPFWEAVFDVITPIKLLDLTNPNNNLIRRLVLEAPGTYHHSLVVANLAETAAYDIGANTSLARVGAYYHDIGKLKYPGYFSENQLGENPHDFMDPYSSTQVIVEHTTYGEELAKTYKLPRAISDIAAQHHGNTLVKYFYYKGSKLGDVNEADYRYKNTIPQSKESAVVMLADTVEAAIRSLKTDERTRDKMEQMVKTLIKDKLDDGQLVESSLKIKDLDTIRESFMRVLAGMYHERVTYPKSTTKELVSDRALNPGDSGTASAEPGRRAEVLDEA